MAMRIVDPARAVTGGVDTHLELNVAAAMDALGGLLGVAQFPTTVSGHSELLAWLQGFGPVALVGIEGTSSYGAGLARHLRASGVEVVEVDRPNRQSRRRTGKSDPADAIEAARAALSGRAQGAGKTKDGNVEAIRALVVAKRSARSAKIQALNQIRNLVVTAPEDLREQLKGASRQDLAAMAAALRPRASTDQVGSSTRTALCMLGRPRARLGRRETGAGRDVGAPGGKDGPRAARPTSAWASTRRPRSSYAATTPGASAPKGRGRTCAGWRPFAGIVGQGHPGTPRPGRRPPSQFGLVGDPWSTTCGPTKPLGLTWSARVAEGRSKLEVIRVLKRYVARELYRYLPRA